MLSKVLVSSTVVGLLIGGAFLGAPLFSQQTTQTPPQ